MTRGAIVAAAVILRPALLLTGHTGLTVLRPALLLTGLRVLSSCSCVFAHTQRVLAREKNDMRASSLAKQRLNGNWFCLGMGAAKENSCAGLGVIEGRCQKIREGLGAVLGLPKSTRAGHGVIVGALRRRNMCRASCLHLAAWQLSTFKASCPAASCLAAFNFQGQLPCSYNCSASFATFGQLPAAQQIRAGIARGSFGVAEYYPRGPWGYFGGVGAEKHVQGELLAVSCLAAFNVQGPLPCS